LKLNTWQLPNRSLFLIKQVLYLQRNPEPLPDFTTLLYSTYLGGSGADSGNGIAVDSQGAAVVAGTTSSTNFPTLNAIQSSNAGSNNAFVAKIAASGTTLVYSTYMGGSGDNEATAVALDVFGNAVVAGFTNSTNFPVLNPAQSANAGGYDAMVFKIAQPPPTPAFTNVSPETGTSPTITASQNITLYGTATPGVTVTISRAGVGVLGSVTANATTGDWSFDYSGTTLSQGTYAFTATAEANGYYSQPTQPFLVTIDLTDPTVTLSLTGAEIPAVDPNKVPFAVTVTARSIFGVPDGTVVDIDAYDGSGWYLGAETGTLIGGVAVIPLSIDLGYGVDDDSYDIRARVADPAGNQGISNTISGSYGFRTILGFTLESAEVLSSDPVSGLSQQQLGDVTTSIPLDLDQSPGTTQSGNAALVYNSDEVSVCPVIQAEILAVVGAVPSDISAVLTWNGVTGTTLTYDFDNVYGDAAVTIAAQVPTPVTTTGRYDWSLKVVGPGGDPCQTICGTAFVVAEDGSPFGAGWTFSNTSQLYSIAADGSNPAGILRVYGTGGYRFYTYNGSGYTSPAGDNGTFSANGSGWEYSTPDGQTIQFNSNGMETSWTSADGHETLSYRYNGSNQLVGMTAIDGAVTTFSYGTVGTYTLLESISTVNGRTTEFSHSTAPDVTSVTNPDEGIMTFTYDSSNHLTSEIFDNEQLSWAYSNGMLATYTVGNSSSPDVTSVQPAAAVGLSNASQALQASETNADGYTTYWQLDSQGRPLVVQDAEGGVTSYTYTNGFLTSETDPLGRTTTYTLDSDYYVTEQQLPDGSVITYQYQTAFHALISETEPNGNTTTYAYDAEGHLISQTNALGQTTSYTYNSAGEEIAMTDPLGQTASYAYDSDRRLISTTDPLGDITTYTYDANGNPLTTTDPSGHVTTTLYDVMGREVGTINALGNRTTMTYLSNGLLLSQSDARGDVTTYAYDSTDRGLVVLTLVASGSSAPADTDLAYDNAGQQIWTKDPMGEVTTTAYDSMGRVVGTTNPLGNTTQTVYDLDGEVVATEDSLGNWTTYTYDARGWQVTSTDPQGEVTTTTYDLNGNAIAVTNPAGQTTSYQYDALNRQTVMTDSLGNSTTTVYDAAGNVLSTIDPDGNVTSYAYDADNREILEIDAYGTSLQQSTTTVYDKDGNTISVTNPLGQTTTYQYDAINEQTVETNSLGQSTTTVYDAAGNVISVTDYMGNVTTYSYDAQNRQITDTNPLNQTVTYLLDAASFQAAEVDALGNESVNLYNADGQSAGSLDSQQGVTQTVLDGNSNVAASIDANGNVTSYVYDSLGRQIEEIDPTGGITTTVYDSAGNVLSTIDPNGDVTSYAYDSDNREIEEIDAYGTPLAVTTTMIYDADGNLLSETTGQSSNPAYAHPETTSYAYDSLDRQTEVIDGYGTSAQAITTTIYDANGNVLSTIDPNGNVTSYAYDANGNQIEEIDAYGTSVATTTTMIYDANGDLLSETTGQSSNPAYAHPSTTSYAYDANGNEIEEIDAYGTSAAVTTTMIYDADGNLLSETTGQSSNSAYANPETTSYAYDSENRQIAEIDAYGTSLQRTTTTVYDANGNVINTINALGAVTTYIYDGDDRQIAEQTPVGGTETTVYDHDGNVIARIDQLGHVTSYSYNALNQQVTETDALGDVTTYAYDAAGNQTTLTDADGNTTTMVYDTLNRLVEEINPLGDISTYAYDPDGLQISSTDADGHVQNVTYDSLNRKIGETWLTFDIAVNVQTFTYDAAGNQLTAADYNGAYTMAYDALDRMTSEQQPFGQTLTFAYDAENNQTVVQDSQSGTTTSVYDVLNRLTTIEFGGPGQTTLRENLTYTALDQIATEDRYTDLAGTQFAGEVTYSYDSDQRVIGITDTYANGSVLASYVYNYDEASNLTSEVDNGVTTSYSYNADNELTGSGSTTYGYDATGNRTNTGYVTGPDNELLSDGTNSYTYDAQGNRITEQDGSDITTYMYDNDNRLVGVIQTVGGTLEVQATYVYDVFGDRIETEEYTAGSGETTTEYAYNGVNVWAQLSGTGSLEMRQFFLPGQDQVLARISASGTAAWYDTDHLGSVRDVVNYAGTMVLDQIAYDAYGNITSETNAAQGDAYKYDGYVYDAAIGLYYVRARYYAPSTGVWISQDPLGFDAGSPDLYSYVRNDPTTLSDPTGKLAEFLAAAAALGFGGAAYSVYTQHFGNPAPVNVYIPIITVRVTLLRVEKNTGPFSPTGLAPTLDAMANEVRQASQFWEQYGVRLRVVRKTYVRNDSYYSPDVADVNKAVDHYASLFPDTVIVLGVRNFTNEPVDVQGITADTRKGFATKADSAPYILAHEFGHVFWANSHVLNLPFSNTGNNIMIWNPDNTISLLPSPGDTTKPFFFLSAPQVQTAREYILQQPYARVDQ
jgi:RHS repeat-associated protein